MEEKRIEEMRNQFAILKEELGKQEIVSDSLLRNTMNRKSRAFNDVKKIGYAWAIVALPLLFTLYLTHLTSLAFVIATYLLVGICFVSIYHIHKPVDKLNYMKDDLGTVANVMAAFKKQYSRGLSNTLVICVLWAIWFCYELWRHNHTNPWLYVFFVLVGGIWGGISGYKDCRKAMNAAQEIVNEIEKT